MKKYTQFIEFKPTREFPDRLLIGTLINEIQNLDNIESCTLEKMNLLTGRFSCLIHGDIDLAGVKGLIHSAGYQINSRSNQ